MRCEDSRSVGTGDLWPQEEREEKDEVFKWIWSLFCLKNYQKPEGQTPEDQGSNPTAGNV